MYIIADVQPMDNLVWWCCHQAFCGFYMVLVSWSSFFGLCAPGWCVPWRTYMLKTTSNLTHHWLCGRIRPSISYFFHMHKTSSHNDRIFVISSLIDSKYSELSKYVSIGPRTFHFNCIQRTFSAEDSLVGCRMAEAKWMK
jgi:hypothetical protein